MKIVFLHLSDLHLQSLQGASLSKIQATVDSLSIYNPLEGIVIIVSGDIAASGTRNQYKDAATFLGRLISSLMKKYSLREKNIKVLLVPGNHDIDWGNDPRLTPEIIRAFNDREKTSNLHLELKRMKNYFNFSNSNKCFFTWMQGVELGQLITRKILHFDTGYRIEANLINTAPFSCDSDDGLHYLPEEAIQLLSNSSNADISIIVMHHSPDWFEFSQKKELEKAIAQRCSLAFYGHEHLPGTQQIIYDNGNRIMQQAGGAWWQKSAPMISEYYASMLDTDTRSYSLNKFTWNQDNSNFNNNLAQEHVLMVKSLNGSKLTYCEDYILALMEDSKHDIAQSICDYFVFPDLRFNTSKEYANGKYIHKMEDFIQYIKENKYIAILGGSNSGKSTLLKMLFKALQSHMVVLYCGIDDITGRSQENILKELVHNTYGENSYSAFQQFSLCNKVILIDDLHRISSKHLDKFLRGIENVFGTIIVATEETSQFDVVEMVKDNIKSKKEFRKVTLARLYAEKRLHLIKKIVWLKTQKDELKTNELARILEQCLNTYKLAFRTEIDFVVQFVSYYCTHMGKLDKSDATVFSKVFEASIERAIIPHLIGRKENPNDIIVALSEIAYYIHFNREYPISAQHINQVIECYNEYYDNRYLTAARFIDIAELSGLLKRTSTGYEYRFVSKNHLAYLVAKAINRKFHDTGITNDLELVVRQSCFSINGDILMFLTYISDNVNIPRLLLAQAVSYVKEWSEFVITDKKINYLQTMPSKEVLAPEDNQKEKDVREQAVDEEENDMIIETLDIYDYDDTKIDEFNNQLIRSFLQLKIIARNFSAFISILPAPDKKEYVHAMYQLPNKIFNKWSESIDNTIHGLIEEIITWQESKDFEGKKLSRENILQFFQDVSLNMLLNLYYLVASFGVDNNTVDYLSQQDYISLSLNYQIERLMFFEKVDDHQAVIKEAEHIYEENTDGIVRNMVISILHHMLVYSNKITDRERRRISSKYFSPRAQTRLLVDRQKALSGKGI